MTTPCPVLIVVAFSLAALAGCDDRARSGSESAPEPPPPPVGNVAPSATTDSEPRAEHLEPGLRGTARGFASRVLGDVADDGRQARVVQRPHPAKPWLREALVVADRARFAVVLVPSDVWLGAARRTYRVMGSSTVRVAGPTRLPLLVLETGDCSDQ